MEGGGGWKLRIIREGGYNIQSFRVITESPPVNFVTWKDYTSPVTISMIARALGITWLLVPDHLKAAPQRSWIFPGSDYSGALAQL